jgi:hypothetical protein
MLPSLLESLLLQGPFLLLWSVYCSKASLMKMVTLQYNAGIPAGACVLAFASVSVACDVLTLMLFLAYLLLLDLLLLAFTFLQFP